MLDRAIGPVNPCDLLELGEGWHVNGRMLAKAIRIQCVRASHFENAEVRVPVELCSG
jgi:hypothetical protein